MRLFIVGLLLLLLIGGCQSASPQSLPSTVAALATEESHPVSPLPTRTPRPQATQEPAAEAEYLVSVDTAADRHSISPLIYGLSGAPEEDAHALRIKLNSWGGNNNTRYNWRIGHAWNAARDWYYRNGNYGVTSGSASDSFIRGNTASGAAVRLALPTLGWVARNDDNDTCSFPDDEGNCTMGEDASCRNPRRETDPELTSVPSSPADIVAWLQDMQAKGLKVRFFAMDNEPELWGVTHYDVHPTCTTYQEILDKHIAYATAVREIEPDAEITGPVTCCWYYYWNSAAGRADEARHGFQPFLPWYLEQVRQYDESIGVRTLDVLDIHYYPAGLYNDDVDAETAARRLRSTRSLWDHTYLDESWIKSSVALIPTMKTLIDTHYPGTKLGISEWNWGAEETMNGALAIADVLGILGREDVYFAAYWRHPPLASPGFYAFKMYTNYDDQGGNFGDTSVPTQVSAPDALSAFAAVDSSSDNVHLMLLNKESDAGLDVQVDLANFHPSGTVTLYRYDETTPAIAQERIEITPGRFTLSLPPYSITLLVMEASNG